MSRKRPDNRGISHDNRTANEASHADAPWYTEDLGCAKSLVPEGLATIARDPLIVCATALIARAMLDAPAFPFGGWRKHWLG
jgi:hypothetical protein